MSAIAKLYSVGYDVIKRLLIKNNIKIRDNNCYKFKKINEHYFDIIDTEEKAYWLGFIYADGCVCRDYSNFHISLMESDGYHLETLKRCLESEHKVLHHLKNKGTYSNDKYESCMFNVTNRVFVNGLVKCGVRQHKTYDCIFPNNNIVPNELIRHFIRGFFDGDGSVYNIYESHRHPNRKDTLGMSFVGTFDMLNSICEILNSVSDSKTSVRKYKDKDIYDLKYGGRHIMERIYHYLYDNSIIYLQRKFDKFYNYFN